MKKYLNLMVAVMLATICLGLGACGDDNDEPDSGNAKDLIGTWENDLAKAAVSTGWYETCESFIQFRKDGTVVSVDAYIYTDEYAELFGEKEEIEVTYGTWHTEGNEVYYEGEDGVTEVNTFKVKGKTLTMTTTSGVIVSVTFTKVSDSRINKYL